MKSKARALRRQQLDRQLNSLRAAELVRPRRGWVRAIREALGMNGRQLADRMGIVRSHLSQIESAEERDAVTLRTLRRAARAMGFELVYAFVPRDDKTLEDMVQERALTIAEQIVGDVARTMALEAQAVDSGFTEREIDRVANELVLSQGRDFWDR